MANKTRKGAAVCSSDAAPVYPGQSNARLQLADLLANIYIDFIMALVVDEQANGQVIPDNHLLLHSPE